MNEFIASIRQRASGLGCSILFPESHDPRVLTAVAELVRTEIVRPVLILDPARPDTHRSAIATGALTMEGDGTPVLELADKLVASGDFDGCVAGATYTTSRSASRRPQLIGVKPGLKTVSSAFYMVASRDWEASTPVLTFTDCAVVPYPTAQQLADIAIAAADDRVRIVGDEPRVALLSFSTAGSGKGASIDTVREALSIIRGRESSARRGRRIARRCRARAIGRGAEGSGLDYRGRCNVSSFPRWTLATSRTSWCSGSPARARSVRSCRGSRARSRSLARCRAGRHY